ncbi:Leucine-rich repeat [Macleaya cordata]|uniref:Geranylgeranyl transferase type-2 subunit alpha n=1 Tax=Macleaya cordata TaxID=56857 RepID=A0A200PUH5_MACCD|nr:Leucine-rich repeat [Macleaya cordata]
MHGRPRKPLKPEDAASIEKAAKLRTLQSQLLHNHHNQIYTKEALDLSSKLLESNPELYTAWNYRKLAVQHNLLSETDHDSIKSILDEELRIVEIALRRNFKSYGAWHHRKWVLSKGLSSLDHEFKLLDKFQKADARNFHAWNYRRFVASLKNVSEKEELDYTTDMINSNFSNYSAWHNRSVVLSHLLKQKTQGFLSKEKVLTEEYELVHQAIFTDPDDQSGWFYHFWLLEQTITPDAPVLLSSWPIHDSDLIVSLDGNLDGCMLSPCTSFSSDKGTFPLILYFNQTVEGVNSSTVDIKFMFSKNEDISWRPLSTNNSGKSQAWVTYLKFPDGKDHSLKACPVEVTVGHSQGIISSTGSNYSFPSRFAFTVSLQIDKDSEGGAGTEKIVWKDDSFHTDEALLEEVSPILSFDRLRIIKEHDPTASKWHIETITYEIALFRELLLEVNCKIGKLTLARLLMAHDAMMSYNTSFAYKKVNTEEVLELFSDLMKLDPSHSRYYKDEHSLILIEKVISQKKSFMSQCRYYRESTSSNFHNCLCLRLNNLSLSRIGSFEHLLWVRMLDLSYNELQSIEGLEALQLLSCLNLSNNKFRSLTALEPLGLLKSLKVLDISYNEIGLHSIDTTRYLCSSPLSHTIGNDFNIDGVEVADYWEAVLFFKRLELTQLDVVGNAVNDEKFRLLLVKLLPKLKWLDGEAVN